MNLHKPLNFLVSNINDFYPRLENIAVYSLFLDLEHQRLEQAKKRYCNSITLLTIDTHENNIRNIKQWIENEIIELLCMVPPQQHEKMKKLIWSEVESIKKDRNRLEQIELYRQLHP